MEKRFIRAFVCAALMLSLCGCADVAIIGGADGPTAIYVSEELPSP